MKKLGGTVLALGFAFFASLAAAGEFDGFSRYFDAPSLKPFARDLGGLLGAGTFHSGRVLGFSGFDMGVHGGVQFQPGKNDQILRKSGIGASGVPWVQGDIGMPLKIDGFVRGASFQGITMAGGGLRYGLTKPNDKPWAPQVLATGVAHSVVAQDFSASHYGFSIVGSMGTPAFTPYIGAGLDHTRLVVRNSTLNPSINGSVTNVLESRFTAGMQIKPWNFFYIHLAYVLMHGESGAESGLGLRF